MCHQVQILLPEEEIFYQIQILLLDAESPTRCTILLPDARDTAKPCPRWDSALACSECTSNSTGRRNYLPNTSDAKGVYQSSCTSRTQATPPDRGIHLQVHSFFPDGTPWCGGTSRIVSVMVWCWQVYKRKL